MPVECRPNRAGGIFWVELVTPLGSVLRWRVAHMHDQHVRLVSPSGHAHTVGRGALTGMLRRGELRMVCTRVRRRTDVVTPGEQKRQAQRTRAAVVPFPRSAA